MIGWYVDLYYYGGSEELTSFSQLTLVEKHKPLTMYDGNTIVKQDSIPWIDAYETLKQQVGDFVNYIYGPPQTLFTTENYTKLIEQFPSARLSFKKAWEMSVSENANTTTLTNFYIYFPKNKRLISNYKWDGKTGVWRNVDGKLIKYDLGTSGPGAGYASFDVPYNRNIQYGVSFPAFDGQYTNLEDFLNGTFYNVSIAYRAYLNRSSISTTSFAFSTDFIKAVYGDNEPDFTHAPDIPPDNPFEPGGPSGPTDPDLPPGTFDDDSDAIPDSPLPTLSAANTGFTRIYNPTLSQVQSLARYLWTDPDVIQTIWNHIKQFFENPMEAIIGFNLVPVPVPDGGIENFALMYIDTGVQMTVAANQFVDLDCGTVELKRYYGSAIDQSPYTKVSCFLPYIGTVNLNTDEVMGTTLRVKYRVDIVSGSCVAKIFVDGNCLYQYSGHCAITIPISSADFSSYVSAAISVGKLAAAAITAGAGAAMAVGVAEVSQQTNQVVTTTQVTNTARNPSTGRQITTGTTTTVQTRESPADQSSTQASFSGLSPQNVANTVGAIMSSKPHIEHSGSFSGNSGYLGVRRPFLIIERPNMCMPENYQALNGFPAMITMELSTCKGFTRVQQVQFTGMGRSTNPEQAEILELLKSGVIL